MAALFGGYRAPHVLKFEVVDLARFRAIFERERGLKSPFSGWNYGWIHEKFYETALSASRTGELPSAVEE